MPPPAAMWIAYPHRSGLGSGGSQRTSISQVNVLPNSADTRNLLSSSSDLSRYASLIRVFKFDDKCFATSKTPLPPPNISSKPGEPDELAFPFNRMEYGKVSGFEGEDIIIFISP